MLLYAMPTKMDAALLSLLRTEIGNQGLNHPDDQDKLFSLTIRAESLYGHLLRVHESAI